MQTNFILPTVAMAIFTLFSVSYIRDYANGRLATSLHLAKLELEALHLLELSLCLPYEGSDILSIPESSDPMVIRRWQNIEIECMVLTNLSPQQTWKIAMSLRIDSVLTKCLAKLHDHDSDQIVDINCLDMEIWKKIITPVFGICFKANLQELIQSQDALHLDKNSVFEIRRINFVFADSIPMVDIRMHNKDEFTFHHGRTSGLLLERGMGNVYSIELTQRVMISDNTFGKNSSKDGIC